MRCAFETYCGEVVFFGPLPLRGAADRSRLRPRDTDLTMRLQTRWGTTALPGILSHYGFDQGAALGKNGRL